MRTAAAPKKASKPQSAGAPRRADASRERIQGAALTLIRQKGFDATTMRDIAEHAHVSLGLAYHYFENKEALALAFYGDHIARHDEETRKVLGGRATLASRIEAALLIGIDVRSADRAVLLVMARTVLDAQNPISLFSTQTTALRERSIALFREVAEVPEVDDSLKGALALALWALHLGVLLRFVYDASPGQKETRQLIEGASQLAAEVASLLSLPFLSSLREDLLKTLARGGLLEAAVAASNAAQPRDTTRADASPDLEFVVGEPSGAGRERL